MVAPAFLTEIARDAPALDLWLELEGIPHAFGLTARSSSWFSARYYEHRRKSTLDLLLAPPSGITQEVRPFEATSSIGQMTASLLHDDAGIVRGLYAGTARRDNWGRLGQTLGVPAAASGAPSYVEVIATLPAGAVVGDLLYVGRETMEIVALNTPVAGTHRVYRGMYRPPGAIEARAYQHTTGDIITLYPRFLATRRAFVYSAPTGGTDSDKVVRWSGTVRGPAKLNAGFTTLEITLESIESELRIKCFTGQVRGKLAVGIRDPAGAYEGSSDDPPPTTGIARLEPSSLSGRGWTDGERIVFRVGDEFLSGRLRTGATYQNEIHFDGTSADDARGIFGTPGTEHVPGDEVYEVIPVIGYAASGSVEERVSKFTKGDNPIDVALQILLSATGDGSTNGDYDVLPSGWEMVGIDQSRIDVTGIQALRDRWIPAAREIRFVEEPFTAKELLASILRTHLCYPVSLLDDVLTFRFLGPPMPDVPARAVSGTHVVGLPGWTQELASVVGRVILRCDHDPIEDEYRQTFIGELNGPGTEAQEFYAGLFETLEVECPGQWSGNDPGSAKFGARLSTDSETIALRHFDLVRDRLASPFPLLEVECQYDAMDIEGGELLAVTLDGVPDIGSGGSGISGAFCEVHRKVPNDRTGKVTLTVVQTSYGQQHRLLAPSGIVESVTGLDVALNDHEFSAGSVCDVDAFPDPDLGTYYVTAYSPDLYTERVDATVTARVTGTSGKLTLGAVTGIAVGDVVVLREYTGSQPNHVKAMCAFMADATPDLDGDAPHEYTP
jgi:hypothetical protein